MSLINELQELGQSISELTQLELGKSPRPDGSVYQAALEKITKKRREEAEAKVVAAIEKADTIMREINQAESSLGKHKKALRSLLGQLRAWSKGLDEPPADPDEKPAE